MRVIETQTFNSRSDLVKHAELNNQRISPSHDDEVAVFPSTWELRDLSGFRMDCYNYSVWGLATKH